MALGTGPFESHVFPGVYTQTVRERGGGPPAGIRPIVFIGVGQEYLENKDFELVRGSSSTVDQQIVKEDESVRIVLDETNPSNPILGLADGSHSKFRVRNWPIVLGDGRGTTSTNPQSVTVTVDGIQVVVAQVNGSEGYVTLQSIPSEGADIKCTYYFNRTDTQITDDVSDQVTPDYATLYSNAETWDIISGINDTLDLTIADGSEQTVTLTAGSGITALQVVADIELAQISGLTSSVYVDSEGNNKVKLLASTEITIGNGNANSLFGFSAGQTSGRNKIFKVFQRPIVDGSNGGITTNEVANIIVKVNYLEVTAYTLDGVNGVVTLKTPPAVGSTVTVEYYFNTYQDTFDYLPHTDITNVGACGVAPGSRDYTNLSDFVVQDGKIHWGTSVAISAGERSAGAEPFDSTQISSLLIDNRMYLDQCTRFVDTSVSPSIVSDNQFILPLIPTSGNGRDTLLGSSLYSSVTSGRIDLPTNRPDLVIAYRGRDVRDAMNKGPITVLEVDSATRKIKVAETVPPGEYVYATYWHNVIRDDTYTLSCTTKGSSGVGKYSIHSQLNDANMYAVLFGTKNVGLSETIQWPSGVELKPYAHFFGGSPIPEEVTITFSDSDGLPAIFTNSEPGPYNLFDGTSDQFFYNIDNDGAAVVDLGDAAPASLVGDICGDTINTVGATALNITVNGTAIAVTLPSGASTPLEGALSVILAINTASQSAITADIAEKVGTGARARLRLYSSVSPTTPDTVSSVSVQSGTANAVLGLTTNTISTGIQKAVALPATMLNTIEEPIVITSGLNDTFKVTFEGIPYEVTLTAGSRTAAQIASDINTATGATNAVSTTIDGSNYLRLNSIVTSLDSKITIGNGNANSILGFTTGSVASLRLPNALSIVTALNASAAFKVLALARTVTQAGVGTVLQIESLTAGSTSSIAFGTGSLSAFNNTGLGIIPGTSGDVGEAVGSYYVVSSSNVTSGSGTGTNNIGYPGQTYTDEITGLQFTILESTSGSYTDGEGFTLNVVEEIPTDSNTPVLAIPGIELTVSNTTNVTVGDTGIVQTFSKSGSEPAIGDFYYLSYAYTKESFSTELFTSDELNIIKAMYGDVSVDNQLSLMAQIAFDNGLPYLGLKQVLKSGTGSQATAQAFIEAINELSQPLSNQTRPYILVPLTTDTSVISYLKQHCTIQASPRYGNKRLGFFGFSSGTRPSDAQLIAKSIASDRMRCVYPDTAIVAITDSVGVETEYVVDGTFLAGALAAKIMNPSRDFATPYTNTVINGFKRLGRRLDAPTQSQTAIAGINVLEDTATAIKVKQGFTTDMSDLLTQIPTMTQIDDLVHELHTNRLVKYSGIKYLSGMTTDIQADSNQVMKSLKQTNIITGYLPAVATPSVDDPTLIRVETYYAPIFPSLYILVTQNVRVRI
jgi:hypothetical protein